MTYHEVIVGKKPYDTFRDRLVFRFKRLWTRKSHDKAAFDNFRNRIVKEDISDVLVQEVLSVYMISVKLNHMVVWMRLILTSYRRHIFTSLNLSVTLQTAPSSRVNENDK